MVTGALHQRYGVRQVRLGDSSHTSDHLLSHVFPRGRVEVYLLWGMQKHRVKGLKPQVLEYGKYAIFGRIESAGDPENTGSHDPRTTLLGTGAGRRVREV